MNSGAAQFMGYTYKEWAMMARWARANNALPRYMSDVRALLYIRYRFQSANVTPVSAPGNPSPLDIDYRYTWPKFVSALSL